MHIVRFMRTACIACLRPKGPSYTKLTENNSVKTPTSALFPATARRRSKGGGAVHLPRAVQVFHPKFLTHECVNGLWTVQVVRYMLVGVDHGCAHACACACWRAGSVLTRCKVCGTCVHVYMCVRATYRDPYLYLPTCYVSVLF
jgi:hypothetical protein